MLLDVRADARGYFYTEGEPIGISSAGVGVLADSVAVERRDRSYASVDTVAFVPVEHLPGTILRNTPGGVTVGRQPALPPPFFTQPQWVVTPNGTVVVVDPDPYHVEATTPDGTRTIGSPIPYSRLETTDAHLESWCSRQGPAFRISRSAGGAQPDAVDVLISAGRCPQKADPPETLPPFELRAIRAHPDGTVWVKRITAPDELPAYDVVDTLGGLQYRVHLPRESRLVGFGDGSVFVVRQDQFELQWLERIELP
jgi:hypothetical protein